MERPKKRKLSKDQPTVYLQYDKGYNHCYADWEAYYKATELSEVEIKKILNKEVLERCVEKIVHENRKVIVYDEFTLNVFLYKASKAITTARDKKRRIEKNYLGVGLKC